MRRNIVKKIALIAVVLCINSIPVVTYAKDNRINGEVSSQTKVSYDDNWVTREVSRQVNKKISALTDQDFLSITKIDIEKQGIRDKIPEEIGLLKNLEYLNLHSAQLEGILPSYIGELPRLKYLDLGDNKLENIANNVKQKIIKGSYTYVDVEKNKLRLSEGWYYLKGKLCYLDRNGNKVKGTKRIDGKEYQFDSDGNIRNGWESDKNNNYFYYDGINGLIKNNWKQVSGTWYYFNEKGIMQKGLQTIKGIKYYFKDNGAMATGWQKIDNKYYYFSENGGIQYGWLYVDSKTYYLDDVYGVMATGEKVIKGDKYKFSSDGALIANVWLDNDTYVQANGKTAKITSNYSHNSLNYNLFKYMTNLNNQRSVDNTALWLHNGITSNNCVYFASEALRRVGIDLSKDTSNTYQLENKLKNLGFTYSYDLSQLKPGDIVFTEGYTHVYIFMCWDKNGYAYIVDNQASMYGNLIMHRRNVLADTDISDKATHFFYYTY